MAIKMQLLFWIIVLCSIFTSQQSQIIYSQILTSKCNQQSPARRNWRDCFRKFGPQENLFVLFIKKGLMHSLFSRVIIEEDQ